MHTFIVAGISIKKQVYTILLQYLFLVSIITNFQKNTSDRVAGFLVVVVFNSGEILAARS
jgi:hypothetical protein